MEQLIKQFAIEQTFEGQQVQFDPQRPLLAFTNDTFQTEFANLVGDSDLYMKGCKVTAKCRSDGTCEIGVEYILA